MILQFVELSGSFKYKGGPREFKHKCRLDEQKDKKHRRVHSHASIALETCLNICSASLLTCYKPPRPSTLRDTIDFIVKML